MLMLCYCTSRDMLSVSIKSWDKISPKQPQPGRQRMVDLITSYSWYPQMLLTRSFSDHPNYQSGDCPKSTLRVRSKFRSSEDRKEPSFLTNNEEKGKYHVMTSCPERNPTITGKSIRSPYNKSGLTSPARAMVAVPEKIPKHEWLKRETSINIITS